MTHGSSDVVSPDLFLDAVLAYQKTGAIRAVATQYNLPWEQVEVNSR